MTGLMFAVAAVVFPPAQKAKLHGPTVKLLEEFKKFVATEPGDRAALKRLNKLNKSIADKHLKTVEAFGARKSSRPIAFALLRLLAERSRYDSAAHLATVHLDSAKDPQYAMWKWWEYNFGERKEYLKMSKLYSAALVRRFEKGDKATKLTVAKIFGKGEAEAKMSVADFKKAIGFKD